MILGGASPIAMAFYSEEIVNIFDEIYKSENVDIIFDSPIIDIATEDEYVQMKSNGNIFMAKEVYDSRPDNINASIRPIERMIINSAKTYLGALDVTEKILLGSKYLNIEIIILI